MTSDAEKNNDLPLMAGEEVQLSFGERHGLDPRAEGDSKRIVLTDRRLIRLVKAGSGGDVTFVSLEDIQIAEVKTTSRGKRPLLRVALLMAGATAALLAIDLLPLALALAGALALGAGYHLHRYVTVPLEGAILFRAGNTEVAMSYEGDMADQAYALVNRYYQIRASHSPALATATDGVGIEAQTKAEAGADVGFEPQQDMEASAEPAGRGTSETIVDTVTRPSSENIAQASEKRQPQEDPSKDPGEEERPSLKA